MAIEATPAEETITRTREAWASFVRSKAEWTWFVTLTFKRELAEAQAQQVVKDWLRAVARDLARSHVWFAIGWETRPHQAPHFHLLLAVSDQSAFTRATAQALWIRIHSAAGFARFERYEPARGAAHYLIRHEHQDINVACPATEPRCRRKHCDEAPSAW